MARKSFFEMSFMRTRIKSSNVSLFPEAALGYLLGPLLALVSNGVVNVWLIQYWDKVLGLGSWAPLFETILPIVSAVLIIIGNLSVGKLMERKPSLAGKARPLILLGMPIIAVALLVLFLVPFPGTDYEALSANPNILTLVFVAVGYNLYYAVAWPFYYTSSNSLVNLSTRDGGKRGLLSTAIMAAQLGAAGLAGMAGGFLVDLIGLLPNPEKGITAEMANGKWTILMIIMIAALVVGCLLIYYFTRERISEEQFKLRAKAQEGEESPTAKKVSMGDQIKICVKDKYWWLIIIFFFLYQFGGQMKNNSMSFYSQAFTDGGTSLSSLINTVGAAPTAVGMVLVWPLANKLTKAGAIGAGGILAALGGSIAFLNLIPAIGGNIGAVSGIAVGSFCVKALGTAPAMYISLALMANVIDHQEAIHGVRTDGFTMAVYGSIMVAMAGVCNGIIVGLNSLSNDPEFQKILHTILAFGVESTCYILMAVMFIFMKVEKFTRVDNKAINADQKAEVLARGEKWVEPEERKRLEEEENARIVEQQRVEQLKLDCQKSGLNFEEENAKYLAKQKELEAAKEAKEAAAKAKRDAKEAALSEEEKAAKEAKKQAREAKQQKEDEEALKELNEIRAKLGRTLIA